jgi:diguanylate cyclase (GGDEF)-like protein
MTNRWFPNRWLSIGLIAAAMFIIMVLDIATGSAPVQHLYYLPIIFAAIRFKRAGGLVVAALSILTYHLANPSLIHSGYEQSDIIVVILFVVVGLTTAKMVGDAERLRALATTDDLTGLHNLRSFESHLARLIGQAKRASEPLSLLSLDMDHLKPINDSYGHLAGAEAVRCLGQMIARWAPPQAIACRYGGDEFAIILPGYDLEEALEAAEHLRRLVYQAAPTLAGQDFPPGTLSISIGASCAVPESDCHPKRFGLGLFHAADQALYCAKESGRNRVCAAHITARHQVQLWRAF